MSRTWKRIATVGLVGVMIASMVGCEFSGEMTKGAKYEDVKTVISEINALENYSSHVQFQLQSKSADEPAEYGEIFDELFDLKVSSIVSIMESEKLNTDGHVDFRVKRDAPSGLMQFTGKVSGPSTSFIAKDGYAYVTIDEAIDLMASIVGADDTDA